MPGGPALSFHYPVAVRFRDLDPMGHVHHSLPIVYVEEARAAFWREIAGRPGLAEIDYVLGEITVRYHRRIPFPAQLDVRLWVAGIGRSSITMEFEVCDPGGNRYASGRTVLVMYDYQRHASMPVPTELRERIAGYQPEERGG